MIGVKMKKMKQKKNVNKIVKNYSHEDLVEKGNEAIANFQPELAIKFFRKAHEMASTDTNIMDALADALIQTGDHEEAKQLLVLSTSLAPLINPYKWCYLAQLLSGHEALQTYQKAIEILTDCGLQLSNNNNNNNDKTDFKSNQKQVAKCYCSIAELHLTDLCFENDAEIICENSLKKSLEIDTDNIDALQTYASCRISQMRPMEAVELIENVYNKTKIIRDQYNNRSILDEIRIISDSELPGNLLVML
jgi:tetratricopeptide (TPR) repeat protein